MSGTPRPHGTRGDSPRGGSDRSRLSTILPGRLASIVLPLLAVGLVMATAVTIRLLPLGSEDNEPSAVASGTPQLVFAEFGLSADRIFLARADAPEERTLIDTVDHADGWGVNPATSVAGPLIAYTVIPAEAPAQRDTPAEVWVMNLETRNKTRLARDADLLVPPVFTPDGQGLLYRRSNGAAQEIVHIEVAALTRRAIHAEQTSFGMFPVGLDESGALLFVRLSDAGTQLFRAFEGGEPELVHHLSDHIARDWQLSPDGRALSYLAADLVNERAAYRARVLSLGDAVEAPLPASADEGGEQYGPVWLPDGSGITVGQEALVQTSEPPLALGLDGSVSALPAAERGFDVPLGWSPDSKYLAARWFNGTNSQNPGRDATVIVDREGERRIVEVPTEVIFFGWYTGA